jgi:hypothetical protein
MLIKYPALMVISCAAARIGPHPLEIYLASKLGNRPPATQNRDTFSPQPCPMKDAFLLRVYHGSR